MKRTEEALKASVRETPLVERLNECRKRIADMCAKGRGPRMTIPVEHYDDDFYICTTLEDAIALQAALDAEREQSQLWKERANKDSLAACFDRDVKKIKDLQTALTQLQALVRGPILTAARNYQVPCYCGDPNKPCENHDRHYVDRGVIAALDASLDPAPVEEQTETIKALRDERDRLREALEDIRDSIGNGALNVDWIKKCAAAALTPAAGGTRHG